MVENLGDEFRLGDACDDTKLATCVGLTGCFDDAVQRQAFEANSRAGNVAAQMFQAIAAVCRNSLLAGKRRHSEKIHPKTAFIMLGIFVDLETESDVDCASEARAATPWFSSPKFNNGIDEILRWTLWAGPLVVLVREPTSIFPVGKGSMKLEEGRRPNDHRRQESE